MVMIVVFTHSVVLAPSRTNAFEGTAPDAHHDTHTCKHASEWQYAHGASQRL
jgi:hypothetical protein